MVLLRKMACDYRFPTPIISVELEDSARINTKLLPEIRKLRSLDPVGISRSNVRVLGGWHSSNDLHRNAAFQEIRDAVHETGRQISERFDYSERHELAIQAMWAIINPPGSYNNSHIHPGSLWSGVYYVQAPEGCGDIEFIDPRTSFVMQNVEYKGGKKPDILKGKVKLPAQAGRMYVFPSPLYHGVQPNLSEKDAIAAERVVISFNLDQAPL